MMNSLVSIFPKFGQEIIFDIFSIVFFVFILVCTIWNTKKGFIGALISFCAGVGSLFIAILLCKPLGSLLNQTGIGTSLSNSIHDWVITTSQGALDKLITTGTMEEMLTQAYTDLGIPKLLHATITSMIQPLITETGINLAEVIADTLALYSIIAISFVVLWILILVAFKLLAIYANKLNDVPFVGVANRILGAALGFVTALFTCYAVCYGLTFLFSLNIPFGDTLASMIGIGNDNAWSLAKSLCENNLVQLIIESYL